MCTWDTNAYICAQIHVYRHTYIYTFIHTHTHTCVHTYIHIYVCIQLYIYTQTYIHRPTHKLVRGYNPQKQPPEIGKSQGLLCFGRCSSHVEQGFVSNQANWKKLSFMNYLCSECERWEPSHHLKESWSYGCEKGVQSVSTGTECISGSSIAPS